MFGNYILLQIKRVKRAFPAVILTAFLLTGTLVVFAYMIMGIQQSSDSNKLARIGLVGDMSDPYLEFGMYALENMDSSRFTIEFVRLNEAEARKQVERGELTGYALIPDDLVESIMYGENKKITYVTSAGSVEMSTILTEELMAVVSDLLVESQNSIYGVQRLIREYDMDEVLWDATDEMNLRYFNLFLGRSELFEVEVIGIANNLSPVAYYICSILLFFLLLWGITCSPLFVRKDYALSKLLMVRGQKIGLQIFGEYIGYLFLMLCSLFVIGGIILFGVYHFELMIPEWKYAGGQELFLFLVQTIPVAAVLAAMQMFLFELVSGIISGVLLQFLAAVSMGYLSGCFYPVSFMPEEIQHLASILAPGIALRYLNKSITGEFAAAECVVLMGYIFVFGVLTVAIRRYKTMVH